MKALLVLSLGRQAGNNEDRSRQQPLGSINTRGGKMSDRGTGVMDLEQKVFFLDFKRYNLKVLNNKDYNNAKPKSLLC